MDIQNPDPPSRPQLTHWVKAGFENATPTVIMRCFIRCRVTRKCDYPAHVRAEHGLDGVKVNPIIADLVANEGCVSAETVFLPCNDTPDPDTQAWMQDIG